MKFDELYKRVFITEQDAPSDMGNEIAHPDDVSVEPAPVPKIAAPAAAGAQPASGGGSGGGLTQFVADLEEFANKLNGTEGGSLQSLVSQLDVQHTAFEGIRSRTSSDIEAAAKSLRVVSEKLKNFIISAAKG